ncbi:MAG TPA: 4Fe-4S ferredoxin, partial [Holophagaceae bacterium]|nr:4Fe-4S ferredoxin [Holophagaceae bacterium]
MTDPKPACPAGGCESSGCGPTRRDFLGAATATMAAALTGCDTLSREEFLQRNFKELSSDEVRSVIARLEKEYQAKYGKEVKVADTPPIPGVIFGYALDLSRCIGCRRCVHACVKENNQSRDPEVQWIRVLEMDKEEG